MTQRSDFEEFITARNVFEHLEVIEPGDLTDEERVSAPSRWLTIAELDGRAAVEEALQVWEEVLLGRFPGTVSDLRERGLDVLLSRVLPRQEVETKIVLVYALWRDSDKRRFDACYGYTPASSSDLPVFWPRIADGLGRFHLDVHSGFRANFGGILPADRLRPVAFDIEPNEEPDFEYVGRHLEALPEDQRPSLDELVVVVREGSRGVALDMSTPELTGWEVSELIEPCHLETWSEMDAYMMTAMNSPYEHFVTFGYNRT